jgi:hypothetical protein
VLQLCAFVFWEIMKLRKLGIEYIKQFWGILMLIKGVLMLCLVGFRVTTFQSLEIQRQDWDKAIMANQNEYIDMQHIPDIISLDNNVMAIMSLLIYLRLFKFAADTKKIEHLYTVIFKSMAEILPFLVLFLIIYIGFTLAFYSCFGLRVYEYRNLEQSLRSNIAILAGDAAFYPDLLVANKYMAPLLYYFMLLVHYVLLLNMFNAIVVQNMAIVKAGEPVFPMWLSMCVFPCVCACVYVHVATDIIPFHDLGISLLPFSRFSLFPLLPGLEKDTDVVFKELFNNFLDRYYCDSSFPPLFILPLLLSLDVHATDSKRRRKKLQKITKSVLSHRRLRCRPH